jgi:hypothetical protein
MEAELKAIVEGIVRDAAQTAKNIAKKAAGTARDTAERVEASGSEWSQADTRAQQLIKDAGKTPHEVTISFKDGYDQEHFDLKAGQLEAQSDAGVLHKAPNPVPRDRTVTGGFKDKIIKKVYELYGESDPEFAAKLRDQVRAMDADHIRELQLGGPDAEYNLQLLHRETNQGIGLHQIWPQIKNLDDYTPIKIVVERPPPS